MAKVMPARKCYRHKPTPMFSLRPAKFKEWQQVEELVVKTIDKINIISKLLMRIQKD